MAAPEPGEVAGICREPHRVIGVQTQLLLVAPAEPAGELHQPVKVGWIAAQGQLVAAPGQPLMASELRCHWA